MSPSPNGFQNFVNRQPPVARYGDFADANFRVNVVGTPGGFTAAAAPASPIVGHFAWGDQATGIASGTFYGLATAKLGFVHNEGQAVIAPFLDPAQLAIDVGLNVTLYDRGSFWTYMPGGCTPGQKVFARYSDGSTYAAMTGTATQDASVTASLASTGILTVSAVGSGALVVGDVLAGSGVPAGVAITGQLSGTVGGAGTYQTTGTTVVTSRTMTAAGSVETPYYCDSEVDINAIGTGSIAATGVMTIASASQGAFVAGQVLSGTKVPTNAKIISQLTGTVGGAGTYLTDILSGFVTTSTTITAAQGQLAKISTWG